MAKAVAKVAGVIGTVASIAALFPPLAPIAGPIAAAATFISAVASSQIKQKVPNVVGNITDFSYQPGAGIPIILGRSGFAGIPVHRDGYPNTADPVPNPYLSYVIVYGGAGPYEELVEFQVDDEAVTFSGGVAVGTYADYMWLDTQLGATPESTALAGPFGDFEGWDSTSKMSGYAAVLWTLKFDAKDREGRLYQNGEPTPFAIWKGVKCYDPRLDSTYPGGSGSHRSTDQTTWAWSSNPYLLALTYILGWEANGTRVAGCGIGIDAIDTAAFVEGANIADTNSWTCGGVVSGLDNKWDVVKAILQAGAGEPVRLGAKISCIVQTSRTSLATITEDDVTGRIRAPASTARRERKNSIIPRYMSEDHSWQQVQASAVTIAAYVTADGGLREEEVDYSLVQDVDQVAQLAYYDILNRRELPLTIDGLKPLWLGYKPGDCVTVELAEAGHASQTFIVRERKLDPMTATVSMTLVSETAAKHAAALALSGTPPPTPSLNATKPEPAVPLSADWTLEGLTLTSSGQSVPAMVVKGAVPAGGVQQIEFAFRADATAVGDELGGTLSYPSGTASDAYSVLDGTTTLRTFPVGSTLWFRIPNTTGKRWGIGWDEDPATGTGATTISYLVREVSGSGSIIRAYAGATNEATITGSFPAGSWCGIENGATDVVIRQGDGTAIYTFTGDGGVARAVDTAFTDTTAYLDGIFVEGPDGQVYDFEFTSRGGVIVTNHSTAVFEDGNGNQFVFEPNNADGLGFYRQWINAPLQDASIKRYEFAPTTPGTFYYASIAYLYRGGISSRLILGPEKSGILVTAPPDDPGGSGSSTARDTSLNSINSTTFAAISDVLLITVGASGQAVCSSSCLAYPQVSTATIELKWQYRATGGGAFTDIGATFTSPDIEAGAADSCAFDRTQTGLTASSDYDFQLVARRTFGTDTVTFGGSASVSSS